MTRDFLNSPPNAASAALCGTRFGYVLFVRALAAFRTPCIYSIIRVFKQPLTPFFDVRKDTHMIPI